MTPTGRVKSRAIQQAIKTPHHFSWSWSLKNSQVNMVTAMLAKSRQVNHHSGTCLYFLMSFVCTSIFFSWKADLLNCHISLHPWKISPTNIMNQDRKNASGVTSISEIRFIYHLAINLCTFVTLSPYCYIYGHVSHFKSILVILITLFSIFFNSLKHFPLETSTSSLLVRFNSIQLKFFQQKNQSWQKSTKIFKNVTIW